MSGSVSGHPHQKRERERLSLQTRMGTLVLDDALVADIHLLDVGHALLGSDSLPAPQCNTGTSHCPGPALMWWPSEATVPAAQVAQRMIFVGLVQNAGLASSAKKVQTNETWAQTKKLPPFNHHLCSYWAPVPHPSVPRTQFIRGEKGSSTESKNLFKFFHTRGAYHFSARRWMGQDG